MRKIQYFTLLAGVCVLTASCDSLVKTPQPLQPPPQSDFQCLAIPSSWNEPGSVFYVDKNKVSYRVGKVPEINGTPGPAALPVYEATSSMNVGGFIKTLEQLSASSGWTAQLNAEKNASISIKAEYDNVTMLVTEEPKPDSVTVVSKWFSDNGYRAGEGNTYFLVRDALAATKISYEIKRADMGKLGGEARFKSVAEGKLNVLESTRSSSLVLNKVLSSPVNVCIKPQRIIFSSAASGAQFISAIVEQKGPIEIRDVHMQNGD